ncbi:hypothetical protein H5119_19260 [Pseudoalteromonas sp. SG45-5]|uniref:DUF6942 family protein n=1 Tax=unclassified Pseudoalteromonas TaxID=194690 RepID=UPI0015FE79CB|nr:MULTISPECIES: hypothetical protein [unclassified Pseudoalteromonas]MBB1387634.1 hypothetical protein [Pseudoalteromonas sp. SG45-5]MBB1395696.1 hypothetical protein [Pseudoalteromonas sp. SG44-4]MBB1449426.1 hypothetical protein [Pseudoalteromonas sp. SG41-6]
MNTQLVGLGDTQFSVAVYVAKAPPMPFFETLECLEPVINEQINTINQHCGNGWRKVFNVYAKVLFALPSEHYSFAKRASTWQQYRDEYLLQKNSKTALLFSAPDISKASNKNQLHIIAGRTHAKNLLQQGKLHAHFDWLDDEFAIDTSNNIIVCPYFDYRQLSNIKIARLSELVAQLKMTK